MLQIFLPHSVVAREFDPVSSPPIRSRFQDHDPEIERYAFQIMAAAQSRNTIDDIRLSELISRLGDVLAHDAKKKVTCAKGGVPPHRLRRVLELISSAVSAPEVKVLSLEQLARVAELSPFHFARAFRETVGDEPLRLCNSQAARAGPGDAGQNNLFSR